MSKVTLYTMSICPGCVSMKHWLQEHNIPYTEKIVGQDITVNAFFEKFGHGKGVPAATVNDEIVEQWGLLTEYGDNHGNCL